MPPPGHGVVQGYFPPGGRVPSQLPPSITPAIATGGRPLPPAVRQKMDALFGTSFADVRIHVGQEAPSIGALAFTHGSHIHFAPGAYDPSTPRGEQVLAHELAHVVQQRAGRVPGAAGGMAVVRDARLDAEAARAAATIQPIGWAGLGIGGLAIGAMWLGWKYGMGELWPYRTLRVSPVPPIVHDRMMIPAGTRVYHGTTWSADRWWQKSTPGRKNDEDGGVSYTLDPKATPKGRNHDVIAAYAFRNNVQAIVCRSKGDFRDYLDIDDPERALARVAHAPVCYTNAEKEIKIRMEDGGHYLQYVCAYSGDPNRPRRR